MVVGGDGHPLCTSASPLHPLSSPLGECVNVQQGMVALNPVCYLLEKARDGLERVAFYQETQLYFNRYYIYFESDT